MGKDHQQKDVLIVKQILLISIIENVWRAVQRICMLISGFKGLNYMYNNKINNYS